MTRDEARKVIIAACFQDASGEKNYIENAIEKIVAAAKIEGLRIAMKFIGDQSACDRINAEIAKLEKGE